METVLLQDSPLATYLEGTGETDSENHGTSHSSEDCDSKSNAHQFAPSLRFLRRRRQFTKPIFHRTLILKIKRAYANVVNATLGKEDNERFLEHFRYIIIASNLINNNPNISAFNSLNKDTEGQNVLHLRDVSATTTGALIAAGTSFALVWLLSWARDKTTGQYVIWRACLALLIIAVLGIVFYGYATRRWLLHVRRNAINSASTLVNNLQALETASSNALMLIQEVELVARGYKLSSPLPPVSRIESGSQPRRCLRLRRNLEHAYSTAVSSLLAATQSLRLLIEQDDLERFLDVYDIRTEDLEAAMLPRPFFEDGDVDSIGCLRFSQLQYQTLRKLVLCCLLSLQTTGRRSDAVQWKSAVSQMDDMAIVLGEQAEKLNKFLGEEDDVPNTATQRKRRSTFSNPAHANQERLRAQARRISTLSTGIRSLQAKLYLLREESSQALSDQTSEEDLGAVSASLHDQYESLGTDLRSLMQAWEAGKAALVQEIGLREKRMSRSSSIGSPKNVSALSSPPLANVISETPVSGSPSKPSNPRWPQVPISPPATEDGSDHSGNDEEVFEGLSAPPRQRDHNPLSREQRIAKMQEERKRQAQVRERREVGTNMVRELQSVIKLRAIPAAGAKRLNHDRVTSV